MSIGGCFNCKKWRIFFTFQRVSHGQQTGICWFLTQICNFVQVVVQGHIKCFFTFCVSVVSPDAFTRVRYISNLSKYDTENRKKSVSVFGRSCSFEQANLSYFAVISKHFASAKRKKENNYQTQVGCYLSNILFWHVMRYKTYLLRYSPAQLAAVSIFYFCWQIFLFIFVDIVFECWWSCYDTFKVVLSARFIAFIFYLRLDKQDSTCLTFCHGH